MTSPFRGAATGAAFFAESSAGAAELKLGYAFEQGLEAAVLVGDPGLGKTTLLRRFAARASAGGSAVVDVFFPRLDTDGLLAFADAELTGEEHTAASRDVRLRRIASCMRRLAEEGRSVAILIDDAHLLRDAATHEAIHLLLNLREREQVRLTLLLAGQRPLLADLARFPAFAQRIGVTAVLAPLDPDESAAYIRHRLRVAERDERSFDPGSLELIHERTAGVPRAIDRLCDMALVIAQADGRPCVDRDDVEALTAEIPDFTREAA